MKQKSYKKEVLDIDENFNFVEEVPEDEIEEYDFDDPKEDKKRNAIIIIIAVLALSLFVGCLYYAFLRPDPKRVINFEGGDLFIVHSSTDFGSTIDSFLAYTSETKSASYTFYVENKNENDISYNVLIKDNKKAFTAQLEKTAINYSLIKNNKEIDQGLLSEIDDLLAATKIEGSSTDYFELKLWSNYPSDKYYSYTIEIEE